MTQERTAEVRSAAATPLREDGQGVDTPRGTPALALLDATEASAGERSEHDEAGVAANRATARSVPDPEVLTKPERRSFTAEYKLGILEEIDRAWPGAVGEILRREGLYSSHLTSWRKARRTGALRRLGRKRGRKAKPADPLTKQVDRLERELARTREQLRKAELIIEVQGKVAGLLGFSLEDGRSS